MWIIASIPFWILGILFLLAAFVSIEWQKPTSNAEVHRLIVGLVLAGIIFVIAAKVAS